jgi:hypothetical protein
MNAPLPRIVFVVSENNADAVEHARTIDPDASIVRYPESGLHPTHHLAALGPRLKVEWKRSREVPIVVLTHSETLLSAFGELIEAKILAPADVAIDVVLPDEVRRCFYTEDGALAEPWPFGFMTPSPDRLPVDVWAEFGLGSETQRSIEKVLPNRLDEARRRIEAIQQACRDGRDPEIEPTALALLREAAGVDTMRVYQLAENVVVEGYMNGTSDAEAAPGVVDARRRTIAWALSVTSEPMMPLAETGMYPPKTSGFDSSG